MLLSFEIIEKHLIKMNMLIMPRVTLSLIKSDEAPDIEQWKIRINELNKPFLITSSSWADDGSGGRLRLNLLSQQIYKLELRV